MKGLYQIMAWGNKGILLVFIFISGCKVDNKQVLNNLEKCFYNNRNVFDSLAIKFKDTDFNTKRINFTLKGIKLKSESGYNSLFYTENITADEKKTFIVDELGYGVNCGFFYSSNGNKNYFENTRIIYKRIHDNWFSFIYFN